MGYSLNDMPSSRPTPEQNEVARLFHAYVQKAARIFYRDRYLGLLTDAERAIKSEVIGTIVMAGTLFKLSFYDCITIMMMEIRLYNGTEPELQQPVEL